MILKAPAVEFDPSDPFENDVLKRGKYADTLTKILAQQRQPFVLAINSAYGTGKTTFIRMWQQQLKNANYQTLYFNAWENDFTESALISLLGELRETFRAAGEREGSKIMKAALKVGKVLGKAALPGAVKFVTAGIVDSDKISEAMGDLGEKVAEDRIKKYDEDKNTISAFRKELAAFVQKHANDKPIVFFVDELDRCRPLFAIEVLEHAKHLFNVESVLFVLSIHKQQLGHSLQGVYGAGMDVDGYLRRFIDLDYRLPPPEIEAFIEALAEKFRLSEVTFPTRPYESDWLQTAKASFVVMSTALSLSLRVIEQCFTQFSLALRLLPSGNFLSGLLVAVLVAHTIDQQFFSYRAGDEDFQNLLDKIDPSRFPERHQQIANYVKLGLKTFPMADAELVRWRKNREEVYKQDPASEEAGLAGTDVQFAGDFLSRRNKNVVQNCVELTAPFTDRKG